MTAIAITAPAGFQALSSEPIGVADGAILYYGCFRGVEDDRATAAVMTVLMHRAQVGIDDLLNGHWQPGPAKQVRPQRLQLPCGTAALRLRTQDFDGRNGETAQVGYMEVLIPVPDTDGVLVVTMTTPSLADWDGYCRLFVNTLRSLRFVPDEPSPV